VERSQTKREINLGEAKANLNLGGLKIKGIIEVIVFAIIISQKEKILQP
jgi:hypothetical protein